MRLSAFINILLLLFLTALVCITSPGLQAQQQQPLLLSQAVSTGIQNYQSIQAKKNYIKSSTALVQNTKNEYLPNVIASIQQDFGTVNGQFGPFSGIGAAGLASSGPATPNQSWNAGFGSIYLMSTNWEVFTFGRLKSKINFASSQVRKDSADLQQEEFIQGVKISGAYLNLLVAQSLVKNTQANLDRAGYVLQVVLARTKSGLNAGVDSSIANAEVSKAKLLLIDAINYEQQVSNQLAQLMNATPAQFITDSSFLKNTPSQYTTSFETSENPRLKYFQSRIDQSNDYANYLSKSILPGLNVFGIFQSRGSGFEYNYLPSNNNYSKSYLDGINPIRSNYAAGISLAWNIMSIPKIKQQVNAQKFISSAYQNEYDQLNTQLQDQLILADQRIENSLKSWKEVPIQYKAASDAYIQKSALYKNGLADIIDLQQALYLLNRAETDLSTAYINIWQSLLLKAATSGDFDLFLKQVR